MLKYQTTPSKMLQQRETISRIAMVLRNVGDQVDEQIRVRKYLSFLFIDLICL